MSVGVQDLVNAAEQNERAIGAQKRAILNPGSNKVNIVTAVSPSGITRTTHVREESTQQLQTLLKSTSAVARAATMFDYNNKIAEVLGDPNGLNFISTKFSSLTTALSAVDITPVARENAVNAAADLCSKLKACKEGLEDVHGQVESDLNNTVTHINSIFRQLATVNLKISGELEQDIDAKQKRDDLLKELALLISLDVNIGSDGKVTINSIFSQSNGLDLLSEGQYARFSYTAGSIAKPSQYLSVEFVTSKSTDIYADDKNVRGSRSQFLSLKNINMGGRFEALLQARNLAIPGALNDMNARVDKIQDLINSKHCLGYGDPSVIRSELVSSMQVEGTDRISGNGKFLLASVDGDGNPLKDINGRSVRPVVCDLALVNRRSSTMSYDDLTSYINMEASWDTHNNAGLGDNVNGIAGNYLLDQVGLIPTSNVTNGNISFQIRLNSGGYEDADFRILNAAVTDEVGNAGTVKVLPTNVYSVEAGATVKTDKELAIRLPTAGAKDTVNIYLDVEVVGAGLSETRRICYTIGGTGQTALADRTDIVNSRVGASDPAAAATIAGWASIVAANTSTGAAIASTDADYLDPKLSGAQQVLAMLDNNGNLRFISSGSSHGIMMISEDAEISEASDTVTKNPAAFWNFNPLFVKEHGNLHVRSDIMQDPKLLAFARPYYRASTFGKALLGDTKAHANLTLASNPLNGDTVVINGVTYTFKTVPAADRDILIGATKEDTAGSLKDALQAETSSTEPLIADLLEFSIDSATPNVITATAKVAGTNGNLIGLFSSIGGGATNMWSNGAGAAATFLDRGTNRSQMGAIEQRDFAYGLGYNTSGNFDGIAGLQNFDGNIQTVTQYFNQFITKMSDNVTSSQSEKSVAEGTFARRDDLYKMQMIANPNQALKTAIELANRNMSIYRLLTLILGLSKAYERIQ